MTVLTAANPVEEAVYGVLQDATLNAAVGGRVYGDIPEDTPRPNVWIELAREQDIRGFGTGDLPEVELRTHVFSDLGSMFEAQEINRQIKALLKDAALTIPGYEQCGRVVYHETVALRDSEWAGDKVHEVVSLFTIWCEQTS